ncbi:MAG: transketolase [Paludibacter sp.]|nr:transketolase [Paludibacter sp.]
MTEVSKTFEERVSYLKEKAKEIRSNLLIMIHKAQSGHPGGSLSSTDFMAALYFDQLRIDPANPRWADRDRFVLSKGHACPVWYTCLAMKGFVPMESIYTLRQLGSVFQGHPVASKCPGIDATSGSLGIGMAQAVGMALEGKMTKKDYMVYAICGDGELQEGIIWEASNTASKYKLDNLVLIIDNNGLQNDGYTKDVMPMERLDDKFKAFGWEVIRINGHKMEEVLAALEQGKANKGKPFCIIADTVKGKGVSFMEDVRAWHGKVPNDEQLEIALNEIKEGF